MESFQPLLGGAATTQQNNENRVNVNNNTTSYGSLKNQSNSSLSNSNSREGNGLSVPQSPLLTSGGRLPPIPSRQRAHSSDDRSIVSEVSTLSGRSGGGLGSSQRGHRSKSPVPGNSGNYGGGAPPKAPPPLMGGPVSNAGNQQSSNVFRPHPLMRSASTTSARSRTNSNDGARPPIRRQSSSGSVFSISSQESGASMTQETLKLLPDPRWGGGSGANRARSFSSCSHQRRNTFSNFSGGGSDFDYGSLQGLTFTNLAPPAGGGKKKHRRSDSNASYASVISVDQSIDPVTTNMSKSSMFKEVTNKGVVRMQLPKDQFRLLSDRDLETGTVYKRVLVDDEDEYYQDYHMTTLDDLPAAHGSECQCTCDTCVRCHSRTKQLPPTHYVMAVKSDIFRRMLDEVSASRSMPCGLFFCGHHEDVRYPSVKIAVVAVSVLFVALLLLTIYVSG